MLPRSKKCACGSIIPNDWPSCAECDWQRGAVLMDAMFDGGSKRRLRYAKSRIRAAQHQPTQGRMAHLRMAASIFRMREATARGVRRSNSPDEIALERLLEQEAMLMADKVQTRAIARRVSVALKEWHEAG